MKKLMIAAAVVCAAVVSQAASVDWTSGSTKIWGDNYEGWTEGTTKIDGTGAKGSYLATLYIYDAIDAASAIATDTQTAIKMGATTSKTLDNDAIKFTKTIEQGGSTYYAQLVIEYTPTAGDAVVSTLTTDRFAFVGYSDGLEAPSLNFSSGNGFAASGSKQPSAGWQSVPEPTSGLLLLLGVAGLALRRRRA